MPLYRVAAAGAQAHPDRLLGLDAVHHPSRVAFEDDEADRLTELVAQTLHGAPRVSSDVGLPDGCRADLQQSTATLTTTETQALVVPVEGREGKAAAPLEVPMRTQSTRAETALVVPYYGTAVAHRANEPLHTVSTRDRFGVAFIAELRGGGSDHRPVSQPLATVTAPGNHHMLVRHNSSKGNGGEVCTPSTEPARTLTTTGHQSLVGWPGELPTVEDCTFRMLEPAEIQAAMAFQRDYRVQGTRREQVRQLNAVTPPAAEWLIRAVVESLI